MPSTTHAQQFQNAPFNPQADGLFLPSLPAITASYNLDEQQQNGDLFNSYDMGCIEGSLHFSLAAQAGNGSPSCTIQYVKSALLNRLGIEKHDGLSDEQQRNRAYIIGLLGSLEAAFTPPDTPNS